MVENYSGYKLHHPEHSGTANCGYNAEVDYTVSIELYHSLMSLRWLYMIYLIIIVSIKVVKGMSKVDIGPGEYGVIAFHNSGGYLERSSCGSISWQINGKDNMPVLSKHKGIPDKLGRRLNIGYNVPFR